MPEPIRLYLDEDAQRKSLVNALRARQVDVLTALIADRIGATDADQLAYATEQGRVILTFNRGDFVKLHTDYLASGRQHAGIIVSDQLPVGVLLRRLLSLMDARTAEGMQNRLVFLSNWRPQ